MNMYSLLITCEHAGKEVPAEYQFLFEEANSILDSHRGWDPGAWTLAKSLGMHFNISPLPYYETRLLIEPNRSLDHAQLFSEFSNGLPDDKKDKLVKEYYLPFREKVLRTISNMKTPVLHLSIHTFTPVYNGEVRTVDLGLLFDPSRKNEMDFCKNWRKQLMAEFPHWNIDFNEPYKGIDDGFTTYLRTQFSNEQYLGIELEWNQKWSTAADASHYFNGISESLAACLNGSTFH